MIRISRYLEQLAAVCLETARRPELVIVLIGILRLAPATLLEMSRWNARAAH